MIGGGMSHRMMWGRKDGCPLPQNYEGLRAWWDSSDSDTLFDAVSGGGIVTDNNDPVARWEDKSGNGYHLTQSTASRQPLLKTNARNGRNSLYFDGSNDQMVRTAADIASGVEECYVISVVQDDSALTSSSRRGVLGFLGAQFRTLMYSQFDSLSWRCGGRRTSASSFFSDSFGTKNNDWNVFRYRQRYIANDAIISLNSVSPNSIHLYGGSGLSGIENVTITIGNASPSSSANFGGHIAEIMIIESDVSGEFLRCTFEYLTRKWAITP